MREQHFSLASPYTGIDGLRRFRGIWHSHLAGDNLSPDDVRGICRAGAQDFVGVTDHDNRYPLLTWSADDWQRAARDDFLVILGFEATHPIGHITCLGLDPVQTGVDADAARRNRDEDAGLDAGYDGFLRRAAEGGAFVALNHPHRWRGEGRELLEEPDFGCVHALEIYNGNQVGNATAQGYTIDLLDECLTAGGELWAAANPDCHSWDDARSDGPYNGYSVVFAEELTEESVLQSLKAGRFYASTGLEVESIAVTDGRLEVVAPESDRIRFIGAGGEVLEQVSGGRAAYEFSGEEQYVRAELEAEDGIALGPDGFPRMAWLQPVRVIRAGA